MTDFELRDFANTLAGHYSNFKQSQKYPKYFAHINTYFRPIEWDIFKAPGFYSEQSYDYSPWSPYRQSLHRLLQNQDIFILENYSIKEPERVAGGGFRKELLDGVDIKNITRRIGCSMYFLQKGNGEYHGKVEPGNCCKVTRGVEETYLVSEVILKQNELITLDRGFKKRTGQQVWGSLNGPLKFKKIKSF